MISIVVADDEENVRDIVANFINKSNKGFEVVGRAENGKSALKLVEQLRPDVLISDICMPVMDGLELIGEIKERDIDVKTVIISGYNEFSYARKAISLGVEEYLLKPFTPVELMDILERVRADIEKQSILEKNMENMQDEIEKNRQKEMQHFIGDVISGNMDEITLLDNEKRFNIEIISDMYCVCDIRSCQEKNLDSKMCGILEQLIFNVNSSYFENRINVHTASHFQDKMNLLLCGNYQNNLSFQNEVRSGLNKLIESVERYYDIKLQCTVGTIYHDWNDIKKSFAEALVVWKGTLENKQKVTFYSDYAKKQRSYDKNTLQSRLDKYVKELLVQIQMSRQVDAVDTVEEIMNCYEQ
ncbi:MAG: response regulator, partial [Eubacteriales bacterium]|nr:response regulator [Eubacteriales bacterium]